MSIFLKLISAAFYVMLFQNLIFNAGYGISEAIRMSAKPRQLLPMASFMTYFTITVSTICALIDKIDAVHRLNDVVHAVIFISILVLIYTITMIIVLLTNKVSKRTIRRIGIAAFNTLVFAVPLINYRSAFTVAEAIGSGIGAGIAYVLAVVLINSALKTLDLNKSVPKYFKGTPAIFIYTAILSMAFAGISGTAVTL